MLPLRLPGTRAAHTAAPLSAILCTLLLLLVPTGHAAAPDPFPYAVAVDPVSPAVAQEDTEIAFDIENMGGQGALFVQIGAFEIECHPSKTSTHTRHLGQGLIVTHDAATTGITRTTHTTTHHEATVLTWQTSGATTFVHESHTVLESSSPWSPPLAPDGACLQGPGTSDPTLWSQHVHKVRDHFSAAGALGARHFPLEAVWGEIQAIEVPPGTVMRFADVYRPAPGAPALEDAAFFIRIWEQDETPDDGIVVPAGATYTPRNSGPATVWDDAASASNQTLLAIAAGTLIAGCVVGAFAHQHRHREWELPLPAPLLWLFTRLTRSRLLDHPKRRALYDAIEADPGVRYATLRRRMGLAAGVATHHLRILREHGLITVHRRGRQMHLYVKGQDTEQGPHGLSDGQVRVLALLHEVPRNQNDLARLAGITQQAVSYHLRNLVAKGHVRRSRGDDGAWRYQAHGRRGASDAEETAQAAT